MRRNTFLTIALACTALLVLTACSTPAPAVAPAAAPAPNVAAATAVPNAAPMAAPSSSITNIVWQWTSVTEKTTGQTQYVATPAIYNITFYPDGRISGQADCNTFSGTYSTANGMSLKFTTSALATCAAGSLGTQYLQLLGSVAAGGPDGAGGLALETAGGEQRMMFKNGGPAK